MAPPLDGRLKAYERDVLDRVRRGLETRLSVAGRAGVDPAELQEPATLARRMLAAVPDLDVANPLATQVGPFYTTEALTAWLGVSRQALHDRAKRGTLLSCVTSDRVTVWPAWQFTDDGETLPGLTAVLRAFRGVPVDGWAIAAYLTSPDRHALGRRTPVEWLRAGKDLDPLLAAAADQAARWRM